MVTRTVGVELTSSWPAQIGTSTLWLSINGGIDWDFELGSVDCSSKEPTDTASLDWTPTSDMVSSDCVLKVVDDYDSAEYELTTSFEIALTTAGVSSVNHLSVSTGIGIF